MPDVGDDAVARSRDDVSGIELAVEDELELHALSGLDQRDWAVLGDLRWPGRSFPNVDFVAVGPAGVFVVDVVDDPGPARIRNDRLRIEDRPQDGRVLATATAARTIAEWLPTEYRDRVHPVVCLRRRDRFTGTTRGVMVCSTPTLTATLTSPEAWLEPQHVEHVSELVRRRLGSSSDPRLVEEPPAPDPAEPEVLQPPALRRPPTLPRQRTAPPEVPPEVVRPLPRPEPGQRPSPARQNRHLVWLVLAISLVMLGLILAIENAGSIRLG